MPPPYEPIGCCIYCTAERYSDDEPDRELGEEHIIYRGIGGRLVLPEASCKKCEELTSGIETRCTPLYDPGRHHLGIRGRKLGKLRSSLPVKLGREGARAKLAKDDHPGVLWGFEYGLPGIVLGLAPGEDFAGNVRMAPAVPDMKYRLARLGAPMHVAIGAGVTNVDFGRFLAKIAHAFATAELGIDGFAPLLLSTIRGETPALLAWLIGCPIGDEPPSAERHEIGFAKLDEAHVTVRIRLFASQHLPTYYVVAGRHRSAWPKAATAA